MNCNKSQPEGRFLADAGEHSQTQTLSRMGKYAGNNAHLTDAIARDLGGVASFNDLKVVSDLLARYNLSLKELV